MKTAPWSRVTSAIATQTGLTYSEAKRVYDKLKTTSGRAPSLRMVKAASAADLKPPRQPRNTPPKQDWARATIAKALEAPKRRPAPVRSVTPTPPPPKAPRPRQRPATPPPAPPVPKFVPKTAKYDANGWPVGAPERKRDARGRFKPRAVKVAKYTPLPEAKRKRDRSAEPDHQFAPGVQFAPPTKFGLGVPAEVPAKQHARNKFQKLLVERGLPVAVTKHIAGREIVKQWRDVAGQTRIADTMQRAFKQIGRQGFVTPATKEKLVKQLARMLPEWNRGAILERIIGQLYGKGGKK